MVLWDFVCYFRVVVIFGFLNDVVEIGKESRDRIFLLIYFFFIGIFSI